VFFVRCKQTCTGKYIKGVPCNDELTFKNNFYFASGRCA